MKKIIFVVLLIFVFLIAWQLLKQDNTHQTIKSELPSIMFERTDLGIEFKHYEHQEIQQIEGGLPVGDMTMLGALLIGTTTPGQPKISIFSFGETVAVLDESEVAAGTVSLSDESESDESESPKLAKGEKLLNWAKKNNELTGFIDGETDYVVTEIDGITALHFKSVGNYYQSMYVVMFRGRTTLLMGQYQLVDDEDYKAFKTFVDTVKWL